MEPDSHTIKFINDKVKKYKYIKNNTGIQP